MLADLAPRAIDRLAHDAAIKPLAAAQAERIDHRRACRLATTARHNITNFVAFAGLDGDRERGL